MTNVVAIIGARSGSRGVPGKNIRLLAGHPLLAYSIRAAQEAGIREIVVSTDSTEYASIAQKYGARAVMRPDAISQDNSTDFQYIAHAISTFDPPADLIVHLRPTTPLRDPLLIEGAVNLLKATEWATALRSVEEMSESAWKCFEIFSGKLIGLGGEPSLDQFNDPRMEFKKTFRPNGYVDVIRAESIYKGYLHGDAVLPYITPVTTEIDTEEDFEFVQYQARKHPELVRVFFP